MKNVRVRVGTTTAAAVLAAFGLAATPAQAEQPVVPRDVTAQAIQYIPGKDVTVGSCKGWLNRRTSDNYVQALGQSWGARCYVRLERRRVNEVDWTQVSYSYEIQQSKASTGFHWNGANAGSRVCVYNAALGGGDCGATAW